MNRERLRVHTMKVGLISAQLTGWFLVGFIAALTVALSGIAMLLKRQRALRQTWMNPSRPGGHRPY
jgi:hypothetical protein